MKNVELKLLIEGIGTYTLFGETEDVAKEIIWKGRNSAEDKDGLMNVFNEVFQINDKDVYETERRLTIKANQLYPIKNISTIVNHENKN